MAFDAGSIEAELTLDRSAFTQGLAAARAEAEAFESKPITIDVDVNTAAAHTKLAAIGRQATRLDRDDVDIDVDVDAGAAATQLTGLRGSLLGASIAGRTASLAITGIIALIPVLGALVVTAAGGLGVLTAAFVALGGGIAAFVLSAVPNISKAAEAMKALSDVTDDLEEARAAGDMARVNELLAERKRILDELTPAQRELVTALQEGKKAFEDFQEATAGAVVPALTAWIRAGTVALDHLAPIAVSAATAIEGLGNKAKVALGSPFWTRFFGWLSSTAGPTITKFGTAIGYLVRGIASIAQAFSPAMFDFMDWLVDRMKAFSRWAERLGRSRRFQEFMALLGRTAPIVAKAIGMIVVALFELSVALAPIGNFMLRMITAFATFTANHPRVVAAAVTIAGALLTVRVAISLLNLLLGRMVVKITVAAAIWAAKWTWMAVVAMANAVRIAAAWLIALGPVGWVIAAVLAVVAVFALLWVKSEAFRNFWKGLWDDIKGIAGSVGRWFAGPFVGAFQTTWSKMVQGWNTFKNFFVRSVPAAFRRAFHGAARWVTLKTLEIQGFVRSIPGRIARALGNLAGLLIQAGKDLIYGLGRGIMNALNGLLSQVRNVGGMIAGAARAALGIGSPSKLFARYGQWLMEGLASGVLSGVGLVRSAVQSAIMRATSNPMGAAAREILRHMRSGGSVFEDLSFRGSSARVGRYNDRLAAGFYRANPNLDFGAPGTQGALESYLQRVGGQEPRSVRLHPDDLRSLARVMSTALTTPGRVVTADGTELFRYTTQGSLRERRL